ncbi:hypothetical protein PCE1_001682 [Barthelona sp. PCE]
MEPVVNYRHVILNVCGNRIFKCTSHEELFSLCENLCMAIKAYEHLTLGTTTFFPLTTTFFNDVCSFFHFFVHSNQNGDVFTPFKETIRSCISDMDADKASKLFNTISNDTNSAHNILYLCLFFAAKFDTVIDLALFHQLYTKCFMTSLPIHIFSIIPIYYYSAMRLYRNNIAIYRNEIMFTFQFFTHTLVNTFSINFNRFFSFLDITVTELINILHVVNETNGCMYLIDTFLRALPFCKETSEVFSNHLLCFANLGYISTFSQIDAKDVVKLSEEIQDWIGFFNMSVEKAIKISNVPEKIAKVLSLVDIDDLCMISMANQPVKDFFQFSVHPTEISTPVTVGVCEYHISFLCSECMRRNVPEQVKQCVHGKVNELDLNNVSIDHFDLLLTHAPGVKRAVISHFIKKAQSESRLDIFEKILSSNHICIGSSEFNSVLIVLFSSGINPYMLLSLLKSVHARKCVFHKTEVKYLKHWFSSLVKPWNSTLSNLFAGIMTSYSRKKIQFLLRVFFHSDLDCFIRDTFRDIGPSLMLKRPDVISKIFEYSNYYSQFESFFTEVQTNVKNKKAQKVESDYTINGDAVKTFFVRLILSFTRTPNNNKNAILEIIENVKRVYPRLAGSLVANFNDYLYKTLLGMIEQFRPFPLFTTQLPLYVLKAVPDAHMMKGSTDLTANMGKLIDDEKGQTKMNIIFVRKEFMRFYTGIIRGLNETVDYYFGSFSILSTFFSTLLFDVPRLSVESVSKIAILPYYLSFVRFIREKLDNNFISSVEQFDYLLFSIFCRPSIVEAFVSSQEIFLRVLSECFVYYDSQIIREKVTECLTVLERVYTAVDSNERTDAIPNSCVFRQIHQNRESEPPFDNNLMIFLFESIYFKGDLKTMEKHWLARMLDAKFHNLLKWAYCKTDTQQMGSLLNPSNNIDLDLTEAIFDYWTLVDAAFALSHPPLSRLCCRQLAVVLLKYRVYFGSYFPHDEYQHSDTDLRSIAFVVTNMKRLVTLDESYSASVSCVLSHIQWNILEEIWQGARYTQPETFELFGSHAVHELKLYLLRNFLIPQLLSSGFVGGCQAPIVQSLVAESPEIIKKLPYTQTLSLICNSHFRSESDYTKIVSLDDICCVPRFATYNIFAVYFMQFMSGLHPDWVFQKLTALAIHSLEVFEFALPYMIFQIIEDSVSSSLNEKYDLGNPPVNDLVDFSRKKVTSLDLVLETIIRLLTPQKSTIWPTVAALVFRTLDKLEAFCHFKNAKFPFKFISGKRVRTQPKKHRVVVASSCYKTLTGWMPGHRPKAKAPPNTHYDAIEVFLLLIPHNLKSRAAFEIGDYHRVFDLLCRREELTGLLADTPTFASINMKPVTTSELYPYIVSDDFDKLIRATIEITGERAVAQQQNLDAKAELSVPPSEEQSMRDGFLNFESLYNTFVLKGNTAGSVVEVLQLCVELKQRKMYSEMFELLKRYDNLLSERRYRLINQNLTAEAAFELGRWDMLEKSMSETSYVDFGPLMLLNAKKRSTYVSDRVSKLMKLLVSDRSPSQTLNALIRLRCLEDSYLFIKNFEHFDASQLTYTRLRSFDPRVIDLAYSIGMLTRDIYANICADKAVHESKKQDLLRCLLEHSDSFSALQKVLYRLKLEASLPKPSKEAVNLCIELTMQRSNAKRWKMSQLQSPLSDEECYTTLYIAQILEKQKALATDELLMLYSRVTEVDLDSENKSKLFYQHALFLDTLTTSVLEAQGLIFGPTSGAAFDQFPGTQTGNMYEQSQQSYSSYEAKPVHLQTDAAVFNTEECANLILTSVRSYITAISLCDEESLDVTVALERVVSMITRVHLDFNTKKSDFSRALMAALTTKLPTSTDDVQSLPAFRWLHVLPQIISKARSIMESDLHEWLTSVLEHVFETHASQAIWHLISSLFATSVFFKLSHTTEIGIEQVNDRGYSKVSRFFARLIKSKNAQHPVLQYSISLVQSCFFSILTTEYSKGKHRVRSDVSKKVNRLLASTNILFPSIMGLKRAANDGPVLRDWKPQLYVFASKTSPRKLEFNCSDGIKRVLIAKAMDDVRLDNRALDVVGVLNTLFTAKTKQRAYCNTYSAIPLLNSKPDVMTKYINKSGTAGGGGILEFIENVEPIRDSLSKVYGYMRYEINGDTIGQKAASWWATWPQSKGRQRKPATWSSKHVNENLSYFEGLKKFFPPVLGHYFHHNGFTKARLSHQAVYLMRNRFVVSAAQWSMVGYILGLGDRHLENVMMDYNTGAMVHIDFGFLFDSGYRLSVPELVPFRLTGQIEHAFGPYGMQNVFNPSAINTLDILRENSRALLGVFDCILSDFEKLPNVQKRSSKELLTILQAKLNGITGGLQRSTKQQVRLLVAEATSKTNLSKMYPGWLSFL